MKNTANNDVQQLRDQAVFPDAEVLQATLGPHYAQYEVFMAAIGKMGLQPAWKYYCDGQSWLCKVSSGKKTCFWVSVWDGFFQITFFFTEKTRDGVSALDIEPQIKEELAHATPVGKLIPLMVRSGQADTNDMLAITCYKMSLR